MDKILPLDELKDFVQHEKELLLASGLVKDESEKMMKPSKKVVDFVLNYSKALSVRKSREIENFEMILN